MRCTLESTGHSHKKDQQTVPRLNLSGNPGRPAAPLTQTVWTDSPATHGVKRFDANPRNGSCVLCGNSKRRFPRYLYIYICIYYIYIYMYSILTCGDELANNFYDTWWYFMYEISTCSVGHVWSCSLVERFMQFQTEDRGSPMLKTKTSWAELIHANNWGKGQQRSPFLFLSLPLLSFSFPVLASLSSSWAARVLTIRLQYKVLFWPSVVLSIAFLSISPFLPVPFVLEGKRREGQKRRKSNKERTVVENTYQTYSRVLLPATPEIEIK